MPPNGASCEYNFHSTCLLPNRTSYAASNIVKQNTQKVLSPEHMTTQSSTQRIILGLILFLWYNLRNNDMQPDDGVTFSAKVFTTYISTSLSFAKDTHSILFDNKHAAVTRFSV
jgi:hypothetical protein